MLRALPLMAICLAGLLSAACGNKAEPAQATANWRVSDAHMNEMPPGQTRAAVYLRLENSAARERIIHYVATPVAGTAEVHRHFHEDGMMKMRAVPHARVAANSVLEFKPHGYHIMLLDVAEAPAVGSHFPLTFEFDGGEKLEVDVEVRPR
ncbi:MAG: copper chaperone PCu(A)C [Cellvibrionaceae bacterium]|nr:copper chaperone PCu(A)C [Cellvibrionaceae bacterium]